MIDELRYLLCVARPFTRTKCSNVYRKIHIGFVPIKTHTVVYNYFNGYKLYSLTLARYSSVRGRGYEDASPGLSFILHFCYAFSAKNTKNTNTKMFSPKQNAKSRMRSGEQLTAGIETSGLKAIVIILVNRYGTPTIFILRL